MWEHYKSHHQYTELDHTTNDYGKMRARSATTGRWVWLVPEHLREIHTPTEVQEAEAFVRKEHLQHLAWQLSRELPYNLGVAVTNIALWGHGGELVVAAAALRDEIDRNHHPETQPPEEIQ
jgi:hypothetical protein